MPPKKAPSKAPSAAGDVSSALNKLVSSYKNTTPVRLKLLDAFLLFLFVTGIAQFVYCVLISNYPFNSFIAGAFGEFLIASVVLHFFVVNFLG
ncbi:oligosaccharyltransferase complex subunit epsilon [Malassezia obtusa]|uniref:Dolichyl-diphosphooligosaccharide--protein glycosyltransferase subunit OST2 n=1 Tax=Malassezia obtusa TaxID=76774 RepID=A0AAF0E5Y3_9BASI|nr:oligosaccharyltransferase complex subunit epsilon [Malassezia obtusa]